MERRGNGIGRLLVFIILGLVLGGILGESFGWLFGYIGTFMNAGGEDNVVRNLFIKAWELKIGYSESGEPLLIDLYMIKFNFCFILKLNLISAIGLAVSLYIMKWSERR